ncbi:transferrin 2 isoform X2 [Oratosquilla oratoria]|uniref:transferrin 2 isoform X2 n=1 Tax=Oratosquilla oratoria TaxID=337810 RepID=UPI003F75CE06
MFLIYFFITLQFFGTALSASQAPLRWCTVSDSEQAKCKALALVIEKEYFKFVLTYTQIECIQRLNHEECMGLLDRGEADVVSLDPNEIFIAGLYHSLVPIMSEIYDQRRTVYYSVGVVKRENMSDVTSLAQLRGKVACFPSVSSMGGWVMPISEMITTGAMEVTDCNNYVKTASEFFSGGCAVNILTDKYNPLGDNNQILCSACGSELPGQHCNSQDLYAGYQGAFLCLLDKGDVAFTKHSTVTKALMELGANTPYRENDFELFCPDGTRAPLQNYEQCNFGTVPANAIMTTSAKSHEQRKKIQQFLKLIIKEYGKKPAEGNMFNIFESFPKYGHSYDLLLSDDAEGLIEVPTTQQNFKKYLDSRVINYIYSLRTCPVPQVRLCVTSLPEYDKCKKMETALEAHGLMPELECLKKENSFECMSFIKDRKADIAVLEAGEIYSAGLKYNLVPFMSELYNLETNHAYVVAVSKEDDPDTDVLYLRGRRTCHPGVMHGVGWVIPMAYLINNDLIRSYGCNSIRAASEYFEKSCSPGALSREYRHGIMRLNLCDLCHGTGKHYCAQDQEEPYFGYTGAFRCLVEGGGHIAFLKHTTVRENTDGRRKEWWARNQLTADYQLLCRDGTRAPVTEYENCNLGKVRSNAIVTRGGEDYNATEVTAFTKLFLYAQQYFGRDSAEPHADLIFQDATQQLLPVPEEEQHYHPYLGKMFLNARYTVDCEAAGSSLKPTLILSIVTPWLFFIYSTIL